VKLGFHVGYWQSGPTPGALEAVLKAEELGFDSVWTAEAYGSDAFTPLAWYGASTSRIRLGTNIVQMAARTPTATAMSALTLDHLSGGRVVLGMGVSGPQVVEGWYGQPYPRPLARTREYIDVVRSIFARSGPVHYDGEFFQLPLRGGTGLGKALKSTVHPLRTDIPILLAAEGPKNVALAAEVADGWLPFLFSPKADAFYREALAEGFARPGARHTLETFEVPASVPVVVHDDVEEAADFIRPFVALYVGGMGSRKQNFYNQLVRRYGFEAAAQEVQDLYLAGRKDEAAVALPAELIDAVSLCGPPDVVRERLAVYRDAGVGTLMVSPMAWTFEERLRQLQLVAELAG